MTTALHGIRVLELGSFHQGPEAARLLGALGAEVIKIEPRGKGDRSRYLERVLGVQNISPEGVNYFFEFFNRGKKSVTVNLRDPRGRGIIYALAKTSDVFVTNWREATLRELGFSYDTLRQHNPRLIYCSASAYGRHGPDKDVPGVDITAGSRAGISLAARRLEDGPHLVHGFTDEAGALLLVLGAMVALYARERQGVGQAVHTSLLGAGIQLLCTLTGMAFQAGQEPEAWERKKVDPTYNVHQCGDSQWLVLAMGQTREVSDRYWKPFCDAMGLPEMTTDARFASRELRLACHDELMEILERQFRTRPRDEWVKALKKAGLPVAPVNTLIDLLKDQQVIENRYVTYYDHPSGRRIRTVGFPIELTETSLRPDEPAPQLGQHTDEVLAGVCGYSGQEIAQLREQGVV